ncbi:Glutaredoxin-like domain/phycoerythrin related domain fusion [Prochlorococcus sp. MIT 0702]|uniref:hypothetical protein n=1 Tax=Prochlorococcus sp. MIT 0703 TaxID=1499504 RepID=UPI0005337C41|nr:Glutaredoxin-like domain/phycoerythrin related domain fusion [Prochlorococcus sp. MIT 0701]KGG30062.1 Glutaredoxin-like domain/phycoerythrin related domain fusion [Prochlorococcus sp. MIT 0703]KGG30663.1 Glutaredoxin-like domain/phycoerythrin related domain fusion [Prochlorococcus sp. MIT 0702]
MKKTLGHLKWTSFNELLDRIGVGHLLGSLLGAAFDQPLRAALTLLLHCTPVMPIAGSSLGLRYLRDRICVPRDMPLLSGRLVRQALEQTAALDGDEQPEAIPLQHRFDQDPQAFLTE